MSDEKRCPTCESKRPDEHPAIGFAGIADLCPDPFHDASSPPTDQETPDAGD